MQDYEELLTLDNCKLKIPWLRMLTTEVKSWERSYHIKGWKDKTAFIHPLQYLFWQDEDEVMAFWAKLPDCNPINTHIQIFQRTKPLEKLLEVV